MAQKMRGVPTKRRTGVIGYNPYDAEPAAKAKDSAARPSPPTCASYPSGSDCSAR